MDGKINITEGAAMITDKEFFMNDLERLLSSDDSGIVTTALLDMTFNISDIDSIQSICIEMSNSPNNDIANLAVICLGHIARLHGAIDKTTIDFLKSKLNDKRIGGSAQDALDDIEIFVTP